MSGLRLLLVGASGVVGGAVLRQALATAGIDRVIAPTRRPLGLTHDRLDNPLVDFDGLDANAAWWECRAVVCTLGTTIRAAGSPAAFAHVDRDLPIRVGQIAQLHGARAYALNSSLGAGAGGNFYLRTKAEAESGVIGLGYASVTIVRPSLIDAERNESRPGERAGIVLARALRPLIPRRYRAVTPDAIARALLAGALSPAPGVHFVESDALR